jgi:hypothetical protein
MKITSIGRAIVVSALALAALGSTVAFGSDLSKMGKAITYPVRKTAANASIDTHRAIGHNSVEHRRLRHRRHRNVVITPGGHIKPIHH